MLDDLLQPYRLPSEWTPDHVMVRMVQAFETLSRMKMRIGPAGYGSGWPSYVHEWADLVAQEEAEEADRRRRKYQSRDIVLPPDSHSVSLMEEAFQWPVRFLGGDRAKDVTLATWAWERSIGRDDRRRAISMVHLEAMKVALGLKRERVPIR